MQLRVVRGVPAATSHRQINERAKRGYECKRESKALRYTYSAYLNIYDRSALCARKFKHAMFILYMSQSPRI